MGVYEELLRIIADCPYPQNELHSESDPVHFADVNDVLRQVDMHVERTGVTGFQLRHEYSSGLVVVYGMDADEPRQRLRDSLESASFEVTERRNQYGTSLEVHPRDTDLVMSRYDLIVDTIAELLPEATDIKTLQAEVEARIGIPFRSGPGLIYSTIDRFRIALMGRRDGHPHGDLTQEGLRRLVDAALESGDIPLLCRSDR